MSSVFGSWVRVPVVQVVRGLVPEGLVRANEIEAAAAKFMAGNAPQGLENIRGLQETD